MTVSVNDYRKNREEAFAKAAKEAEVAAHVPVQQTSSPDASTGDERLDKLARAIQLLIDALDPVIDHAAKNAMGAPTADMLSMCLREYWYQKGKQDTLKEVIKLPAQIMLESKLPG